MDVNVRKIIKNYYLILMNFLSFVLKKKEKRWLYDNEIKNKQLYI